MENKKNYRSDDTVSWMSGSQSQLDWFYGKNFVVCPFTKGDDVFFKFGGGPIDDSQNNCIKIPKLLVEPQLVNVQLNGKNSLAEEVQSVFNTGLVDFQMIHDQQQKEIKFLHEQIEIQKQANTALIELLKCEEERDQLKQRIVEPLCYNEQGAAPTMKIEKQTTEGTELASPGMECQENLVSFDKDNLHMSSLFGNPEKIADSIILCSDDFAFVKATLQELVPPCNSSSNLKVQKWHSEEVGLLLFCLWWIYEQRQQQSAEKTQLKIETLSSTTSVAGQPFYKNLNQLFVFCSGNQRGKDIIYSKLQKQRSNTAKLEVVLQSLRPNKRFFKFQTDDFSKVESVLKLYDGVLNFIEKHTSQINDSDPVIQLLAEQGNPESILEEFRKFVIPEFLLDGNIKSRVFSESLPPNRIQQFLTSLQNLQAIHSSFSACDTMSVDQKDNRSLLSKRLQPLHFTKQQQDEENKKQKTDSLFCQLMNLPVLNKPTSSIKDFKSPMKPYAIQPDEIPASALKSFYKLPSTLMKFNQSGLFQRNQLIEKTAQEFKVSNTSATGTFKNLSPFSYRDIFRAFSGNNSKADQGCTPEVSQNLTPSDLFKTGMGAQKPTLLKQSFMLNVNELSQNIKKLRELKK